jgi:hypothetical protein
MEMKKQVVTVQGYQELRSTEMSVKASKIDYFNQQLGFSLPVLLTITMSTIQTHC